MARIIGQNFQADFCLLVASTGIRPKIQKGFWDRKESTELPFEINRQFFLSSAIADILTKTEPLAIVDSDASWLEALSARSLLGITTYFQNNANGIIMVGYLQPHQSTTQECEWLQVASEVGAIAFYMAQLETVTKVNFDRESAFNLVKGNSFESSQLFKKWYDLTHQQLEQQRQLNQIKDEIITAISDRARNPLSSMKMAMEMLSTERSRPLPPESQARYWDILKQEWQRLNDLINNIVTLKRLETHEVSYNPEQIALKPLLDELTQSFEQQWQSDKRKQLAIAIQTESDSPLTLRSDIQHLTSILSELLTNAGNFSKPGTTVSIDVTQQKEQVAIAVTNLGLAISPQEQTYIFESFRRGEGAIEQSVPGVGLGLSLVKKLVELLNGKIEVASTPTEDPKIYKNSFTLILPI
ncbi:MAG: HAMP domain-containing histidine kinase [Hydrococcus sp. Prado102]|nr:HAMP domain-containing histidine kinase [Hydrococcus sp. Prado102]